MEDLLSEHGEQFDQPMPVAISRDRGEIHPEIERIALALEAAADGELRARLPTAGILAPIAIAANRLISQNARFTREITRVSRRVSSDGRLSERAHVSVVSGAYEEALAGLNDLLDQLTWHAGETGAVARALEQGELGRTMPLQWPDGTPLRGQALRIARSMNALVARLGGIRSEVIRIAGEVGTAGRLGGQAEVRGASGAWEELISAVNLLAANLTSQVRNIAPVTHPDARGDLSRKITVPAQGEILELKETVNEMVDQLRAFAAEVTRVAREVGTEGKLGGQAQVPGVAGTWKDLTESVNTLAGNLTSQVRNIALVTTAVANGQLSRKITVPARGEIQELKATVNGMVDQLRAFTAEVIRVTREVGAQAKLGSLANVPGVAGSWKDLTDSINEMIVDLGESTRANAEQDWLNTNLARLSGLLQGRRSLGELGRTVLDDLAPQISAQYGALFVAENGKSLRRVSTYGHPGAGAQDQFGLGEGLVGQCALEKRIVAVEDLPPGYVHIRSGIGGAPPCSLFLAPVLFEGEVKGVIELASLSRFKDIHRILLEKLAEGLGVVLNTIDTTSRTEGLLEELQVSNAELAQRTSDLEDKAQQLAQVSRYKTEFLANMSHELRTPLNSMLILARLLADNDRGTLDAEQIEYASTILSSGQDLLGLINQILDLSKIEAGRVQVDLRPVELESITAAIDRMFRPTLAPGIEFSISLSPEIPSSVLTDAQRLQQILKNLLANAFKFTPKGRVELRVSAVAGGEAFQSAPLRSSPQVIAFAVADTGIGIPPEKHELIFEAFQQADTSPSRTFGGTGLGLTISRELARLLGGEIRLRSKPGEGSTFTLYLPLLLPVEVRDDPVEQPPAAPPSPASAEVQNSLRG